MPQVFKDPKVAARTLMDLKFMTASDPNRTLCAGMLVFLCDEKRFEKALGEVSAAIWQHYSKLDVSVKNKFSRSLAFVALQHNFQVSPRQVVSPHANLAPPPPPWSGTMDIKLVASYGDFFGLLKNRMFWKDSMDMQHGEYSHALQWLALAKEFGAQTAPFYAALPDHASSGQTGSMPLWSYLADCFTSNMAVKNQELVSDTYRSPQWITRHLIGKVDPIADHFVSYYLNYVYKKRELVSYPEYGPGEGKAKYGSSKGYALDPERVKKWQQHSELQKSGESEVTRLDRDPNATTGKASKTQAVKMKFHGIGGTFFEQVD